MNYEKDLFIDETNLDIEWLDQSMLFMKYAKYSAETQRDFDDVKQKLDVLKAELDKEIRENPSDFGIEKVTEGAIQSAVLTTPRYRAMYDALLDAKFENDMAKNAVQAFNQRKEALENLVKLNGQQYFSGPKVPRDIHWEREKKAERMDDKIGKKLNRNK